MSVLSWILLGLIAGVIASKIVNKGGDGAILNIVLGILGALVGGYVFNTFGEVGVTADLWGMFVAAIAAIVILVFYHALLRFSGSR